MIRFSLSKLIMEMVGTMLLTMFFSSGAPPVMLLGLWILNIFFWKISGSHFNPAVTFAYMFRKDEKKMGWKIALAYMVAQFLGAYVGALLLNFYTFSLPKLTFSDDFIMRAIFQELLCTFIFVFFFMTNTDEKLAFSNEKAINCFILAASYVGARSMFAGQLVNLCVVVHDVEVCPQAGSSTAGVTSYGAVMNPAIAFGISMASLFNLGFEAWNAIYLYPTVPFGAAFLSVLFYELIYKKTQAFLAQDDDQSDGGSSQDHDVMHEGHD